MRLSDVMGNAGLSGYAEIALILFIAAFLAIVIWIFRPGRKEEMDAMSRLPLEDETGTAPDAGAAGQRPAGPAREGGAR